jgi:hypothetical protein
MSDERYLQFPLCMLRNLLTDRKKTIDDIIDFGIYHFSKSVKYDLSEVARQMMYCFYRKQSDLTNDLRRMIQRYIDSEKIYFDEEYSGFSGIGSEFKAELELDQILPLFETDKTFKEKAIEFYQIRQACSRDLLNITCNFDYVLKHGKEIERTIPANEPYPSINKSLFFKFRDHEKTEFDLMQFACYIGIRSILGIKPYCRTNKKHILCRAFGYTSVKHLPDTMNPDIQELFNKYLNRYHIGRILQSLELNWNILIDGHNMKGMYIGVKNLEKKFTLENMISYAETNKMKNKIDALKKQKDEAREKALQQLNKGQQLK